VTQSGPLVGVYVNEGDRVSRGQLLAKVDDSNLNAQLQQDLALVSQAQARSQSSSLNVGITRSTTGAAADTAKAALANAKLVYDQNQQLFRQGYVSQTAMEQARSQYIAAQQQYNSAVAGQQNTGVQSASAAADRAAIASNEAAANALRVQIGQTALYAPFNGVVTARLLDPGAMSSPASPVLKVSQVDTVYINVNVPDEDLSFVRPGTPVRFTSSSLSSRSFSGRIATVNAVPTQGTLSYRARIVQSNPGDILRGGMLVSVNVPKANHPGAIVVPRSAVAQTDSGTNVYVVKDNKAVEVPVSVGLQTDTLSEVRSPQVQPGTKVITTRPDALQNGSLVAVNGGRAAH
ncbi:MAG: efflux RND transporter periplasmic adaptor subunit, partial [Candidatus Eremiobacteraeota bacterium]|nr:efflux RND transporter periplasmic adaptor subunit [Candidatus Eremiobacteraeota bacterium]